MNARLLTITEAAKRPNIGVTTLRRMVWANEISYIDLNPGGKQIICRFTEQNIQDFLRKHEVKAG